MDAPGPQILARLPLAEAVLALWRWVADADSLDQIFDDHRGRCYEKVLSFSLIAYLVRDALLEYGGSGRKSFDEAKDRGELEASYRAAYGKLGRIPIPVSAAMLARCTARLGEVYPGEPVAQTPLPASLDGYRVVTLDGKAIKRVAKRLKPLWGARRRPAGRTGLGRPGHAQRPGRGHAHPSRRRCQRGPLRGRPGARSATTHPREAALDRR